MQIYCIWLKYEPASLFIQIEKSMTCFPKLLNITKEIPCYCCLNPLLILDKLANIPWISYS